MRDRPFLIVGCGSSGSHLLSVLLDTHPDIACGPELGLFNKPALYADFETVQSDFSRWVKNGKTTGGWANYRKFFLGPDAYYWTLDEALSRLREAQTLREFVDEFFGRFLERRGALMWGEQTLSNCYCIDQFLGLYPNASIIHLVRDGRDVMCSMLRRGEDAYRIPARWLYDLSATRRHSSSKSYLEIKYEDLVTRPGETLEKVCEHVGVRFHGSILEDYQRNSYWGRLAPSGKVHVTWAQSPIKGSITSASVGRYKSELSPDHLNLFWALRLTDAARARLKTPYVTMFDVMRAFGYQDIPDETSRAGLRHVAVGSTAWAFRAIREAVTEGKLWPPLTRASLR